MLLYCIGTSNCDNFCFLSERPCKLTRSQQRNCCVLKALSNLVELDLSHNKIASLGNNLNTRLGNIKKLDLAGNELESVEGIEQFFFLSVFEICFGFQVCYHFVVQ